MIYRAPIRVRSPGSSQILSEFRSSGIPDSLTTINARWIEGDEAIEALAECAIAALGSHSQQYVTKPARRILDRYEFARDGGWVCYGTTFEGGRDTVAYFKSQSPRKYFENGRLRTVRYETPQGCAATPILPFVDEESAAQIYEKYGVSPLEGESFWSVVWRCNLPLAITEGLKKALALIAHGMPAIALRGVACWHLKGSPELHKAIAKIATQGRHIYIVFDQDTKPRTVQDVGRQISKLGKALVDLGCQVSVATWSPEDGKGVDDALVRQEKPKEWLSQLLDSAPSLETWKKFGFRSGLLHLLQKLNSLAIAPELLTKGGYLPELPKIEAGAVHVLNPKMASGKTERLGKDWVAPWILEGGIVLILSPMNSLGQQTASRWGLPHIHDYDLSSREEFNLLISDIKSRGGVVLCPDSLHRIPDYIINGDRPLLVVLDEANQVADHFVQGGTLQDRQSEIIERFTTILEVAAQKGAIALSEAGVYPRTLDWIKSLSGCDRVRLIDHNPDAKPWEVKLSSGQASGYFKELLGAIYDGKKLFFVTDSQRAGKLLEGLIRLTFGNCKTVLRIDSETNESGTFDLFWADPNNYLETQGIPDILILSPSGKSGVSITVPGFDEVWGYFTCHYPDMWMQQLGRYRPAVLRHVFALPRINSAGGDEGLLYPSLIRRRQDTNIKGIGRLFGLEAAELLVEANDSEKDCDRLLRIEAACRGFYSENAASIGAQKAIAYHYLRYRLERDGHQLSGELTYQLDKDTALDLREVKEALEREDAEELGALEIAEEHTPEWALKKLQGLDTSRVERLRAMKVLYRDEFPGVKFDDPEECYETVTHDFGRLRRGVLLQGRALNLQASQDLDAKKVRKLLDQQIKLPHRLPKAHLKALILAHSGILALLDGKPYSEDDPRIAEIKKKALYWARDIFYWMGLTIKPDQSGVEIANKLLRRLGLKAEAICRSGGRGNQKRIYGLPGLWEPTRLKLMRAAIAKLDGDPASISEKPPDSYLAVVEAAEKRRRKPNEIPVVPVEVLEELGVFVDPSEGDRPPMLAVA